MADAIQAQQHAIHRCCVLPPDAVGDRDLCLLNTMVFESPDSSGSSCQGGIYNAEEGACIPLPPYAIRSGPRRNIYFRPEQVTGCRAVQQAAEARPEHSRSRLG